MRAAIVIAILAVGSTAHAHPLSFGVLDVREDARGEVDVSFRFSGTEARTTGAEVVMPPRCVARGEVVSAIAGGESRAMRFGCGGLAGETIAVRGMEGTGVQIAVRIERADGSIVRARLDDGTREVRVDARDTGITTYLRLGVEHIAGGIDHLLFVLGLLLVVRSRRAMIAAITSFTIGHSITLALAALDVVTVRAAPVEACIALSIVLLAREVARPDDTSIVRRAPWIAAGGLGLLHGLGFAGALAEVGLPRDAIVPALLGFNVGVELGQLGFVAIVLAIGLVVRVERARLACALGMGALASFFFFERLAALGT
ncbi:HupE/UreJ family protein [Sandaracinus amylolyticus]|uniref:HupE/UreJ family protein n=1 Tax=Sandaracinus amylolyticus TaxID=927083 RepID=UPI001F2C1736|nr:HupE/UreJ family protein [Sandaracinus amylolyticus]UJR79223.1 Hydrogenase/urease accessory protein HupE [Sandaracinus amylolyticus]